jgi:transposase
MGRADKRLRKFHSEKDRLRSENSRLREEVAALRTENASLRVESSRLSHELAGALSKLESLEKLVTELQEKLRTNSQNSSLPPSADRPGAPVRQSKTPSGKKPGGQPGHQRHERPEPPPEKVNQPPVHLCPARCIKCNRSLQDVTGTVKPFYTWEVPEPTPEITAYLQHTKVCPDCQTQNVLPLPPEAHSPFGPRAMGVLALLTGELNLSKRKAAQAMLVLFGIPMATGTVPACEHTVSDAIEGPVQEAQGYVQQQGVKQADETGWRHGAQRAKAYLWVAYTTLATVFLVARSRGSDCAKKLLGRTFGVLVTDRYKGYEFWPLEDRQLCWAHIKRDIQAMIEAGGKAARVGKSLEKYRRKLFTWWYWTCNGSIDRASFQKRVAKLRKQFHNELVAGSTCKHKKTAGTCNDLLRLEQALWTFVYREGVEPTNNNSERSVRQAVLKRKISYGTHSDAGARFIERILTVSTTLRQQHRNTLEFLVAAIEAKMRGSSAPTLLPDGLTNAQPA